MVKRNEKSKTIKKKNGQNLKGLLYSFESKLSYLFSFPLLKFSCNKIEFELFVPCWTPGIPEGQRIRIKRLHDKFKPRETFYYLGMPGTICPTSVTADSQVLQEITRNTDEEAAKALENCRDAPGPFYYNKFLKTTFIKIYDILSDVTVEVMFWKVLECTFR